MGMLSEFKIKKVVSELEHDMETVELMEEQVANILKEDLLGTHDDEDKVDLISEVARGIFALRRWTIDKMNAKLNGKPMISEQPEFKNRVSVSENIRIMKNWMCDLGQKLERIESALSILLEGKSTDD